MNPIPRRSAIGSAVLLAVLLTYLVAVEDGRLENTSATSSAKSIEQGAALYSLHCRSCHGNRGEGIGQLGPALGTAHFFTARKAETGWLSTLEDFITATTEYGRMMATRPIYAGNGSTAVMPPWHQKYGGPLRSDEVRALVAFIMNWEATATGKVQLVELKLPAADPQDPQTIVRGKEVFNAHCSRCHQYSESKPTTVDGPDLSEITTRVAEQYKDMNSLAFIKESVLLPMATIAAGYEDVAREHPCGATLTQSELTAAGAYLLQ